MNVAQDNKDKQNVAQDPSESIAQFFGLDLATLDATIGQDGRKGFQKLVSDASLAISSGKEFSMDGLQQFAAIPGVKKAIDVMTSPAAGAIVTTTVLGAIASTGGAVDFMRAFGGTYTKPLNGQGQGQGSPKKNETSEPDAFQKANLSSFNTPTTTPPKPTPPTPQTKKKLGVP